MRSPVGYSRSGNCARVSRSRIERAAPGSRLSPVMPSVADRDIDGRNVAKPFTAKQGQYLACIYYYTKIHGRPPAESDFQRFFRVTPPAVHQMIKTLQAHGLKRQQRVGTIPHILRRPIDFADPPDPRIVDQFTADHVFAIDEDDRFVLRGDLGKRRLCWCMRRSSRRSRPWASMWLKSA